MPVIPVHSYFTSYYPAGSSSTVYLTLSLSTLQAAFIGGYVPHVVEAPAPHLPGTPRSPRLAEDPRVALNRKHQVGSRTTPRPLPNGQMHAS